ncbi:coenzyme F420-0:L-glutamate ligase [Pseudoalteromonas sp. OOF1S-7]|uniref:coenzyme F420-0:L-glutamate ligase n=1 Tax=Pseudoalteromonas sp. OOF1S-7 TaxID=2917757 RepID=UPI001EF3E6EA|nr:coenzyme F420-0:L-glutamate ligase [Pseudoalteromonas sp. OOF1S-7]MCG7534608.1 coenzyme F420-0:L-glutamate ligase [Pseudoalteromonas sp. OOF1S-7]
MEVIPIKRMPFIKCGDVISSIILDSCKEEGISVEDGDIIVIAQKIISKSEGRQKRLGDYTVSEEAFSLAAKTGKSPEYTQAVLEESKELVVVSNGLIIVEHKLGYVHANAGIDQSNINSEDEVLLLPCDPDSSASEIRESIYKMSGKEVAVIINDSSGRAFRNGVTGFSIGSAGIEALSDLSGESDIYGRPLKNTQVAVADEVSAAASLVMGQSNESIPVVIVKGLNYSKSQEGSQSLIRTKEMDLIRGAMDRE